MHDRFAVMMKFLLFVYFLLLAAAAPQTVVAFQPLAARSHHSLPCRHTAESIRQLPSSRRTKLHAAILTSTVAAIDAFWRNSPYVAAALTCGIKASAADLVAQKRQYKQRNDAETAAGSDTSLTPEATNSSSKTDMQRNLAFILYGALYQGMAQEYIYNHLYPVLFGSAIDARTVLTKVLFDLLVQTTIFTLPIAYMSKAIIYSYSFREALRRYIDDIKNHGLLTKYFSLWGPVQCLTFSIVPEHWRVTFIAFVSFFWLIILSTIASKSRDTVPGKNECSLVDGQTCNIDG